ncbi:MULTISPECIES: TetR/AcrR family transcriptional regulator [Streptomyces]|uniref:TetR/AcrR family transcriptional regulator n=1 Tax=Streptomyces dengpaensis TaxID=2049881 RepID=A0ABM6SRT6_9ACTN|nr:MULTISPECIES: TetR/AcrR family transcriptional regulator [Streptomyces]AVH57097.1 TetR/AcrR family transcriptional regulator [Streptomyces dengpaensis]PIB09002.1 TetR family transcriptional regulator [Streptomyces sp. HG99]
MQQKSAGEPAPQKAAQQKPARVRILDAARELMLTVGLARATTKEIAKAAGCSEAALYKYFASKEELFIRVLEERLPKLGPLLERLMAEPGEHTVEENLTEIARQAALFYEQSFPMAASLYAETQLKRRHDEAMRAMGAGPHIPIMGVAAYLRAEQRAGRIHPYADTFAAASLLLGACAQRAWAYDSTEEGTPPPLDTFAPALARTLLRGISLAGDPV